MYKKYFYIHRLFRRKKMLHFIICDDDALQLQSMNNMTRKWAEESKIAIEVSQFSSSQALLAEYKPERNDILILDIMMPELDGLSLAKSLRKKRSDFHIIFISSSQDFALDAYEAHPYSYLVKPVAYQAYSDVLDKLIQKVHQQMLPVQSGHEIYNLPIMDIIFVEATNRQIVFNMKDGRSIATRDTLLNMQEILLKYPAFFKPHRSYIINMQYIEHFNTKEISMKNSEALIPIARGLDKEFKDKYFQFMLMD